LGEIGSDRGGIRLEFVSDVVRYYIPALMNGNVGDGIDQEEYNILQFAGGLFFGNVINIIYSLFIFDLASFCYIFF